MKHGNPLVRMVLSLFAAQVSIFAQRSVTLPSAAPHRSSKGRGLVTGKKWGSPPAGWYDGVSNGAREVARRRRQIARGIVHVS